MNELYRFLTLAVSGEWRRLDADTRRAQKGEFTEALERCGVAAHAYCGSSARTRGHSSALKHDSRRQRSGPSALGRTAILPHGGNPNTSASTRMPGVSTAAGRRGPSATSRTSLCIQ